jgi:hypothetical protein
MIAMNKKKILFVALAVLICSCSKLEVKDYDQTFKDRGQPPVIVDYYAPDLIRPGTTWKIYLRAEDKDGDMVYVATMLYQEGFGYYATDYTRLEGKDRKGFAGYVSLKTFSDADLTSDQFTMEIMVRDNQGKRSNTVQLPLAFGYVNPAEIPMEWQDAAKHRLGVLVTRIQSVERMTEGAGSR